MAAKSSISAVVKGKTAPSVPKGSDTPLDSVTCVGGKEADPVNEVTTHACYLSRTKKQEIGPTKGGSKGYKRTLRKRTTYCPLCRIRFVVSGTWILAWIGDHNHGDVGVISSSRKIRLKKNIVPLQRHHLNKKKAESVLRHPMTSL